MAMTEDRRFYWVQAGHCTRCEEPFSGNRATAFMVAEYVCWQVLGDWALCQHETVPVCDACVTPKEQAAATRSIACKGCGMPMLTREQWQGVTCSERCAQRERRLRNRHKSRVCVTCGLRFKTTRTDAKFCSGACRQKAYRHAGRAVIS
jgi:hypothetical protein